MAQQSLFKFFPNQQREARAAMKLTGKLYCTETDKLIVYVWQLIIEIKSYAPFGENEIFAQIRRITPD